MPTDKHPSSLMGEAPSTGGNSQKIQEIEKKVLDLCRGLSNSSLPFDDKDKTEWINKLSEYIADSDRIMYSVVSNHLFTISENESDVFINNLQLAAEHILNINENEALCKCILKFRDHANLALRQLQLYEKEVEEIDSRINSHIEPAISQATKDVTNQLIGLVAIFTALSFIVFGGISSLSSIFSALSRDTDYILPTIIVALAWALCIINLLLVFTYFIIRITKGAKGEERPQKFRDLVKTYPLMFLTNFILFSMLSVCSWIFYISYNGIGHEFYDVAMKYDSCTFFIGWAVILLLLSVIGVKLWKMYFDT